MALNSGSLRSAAVLIAAVACLSCDHRAKVAIEKSTAPAVVLAKEKTPDGARVVRATGTTQALKYLSVRVPQISAQSSRVTLTDLIPNGSKVKTGDILAGFDLTQLLDEEREAVAKLADLKHQIEELKAKVRSDSTKRASLIKEAEADVARATIQLRKGPILSDLDRTKNEVKAESARARVISLNKSHSLHEVEETASVRVLELKGERQQIALDRVRKNMERLVIRAPHEGMVALENVFRSGSMGPPQEGDQMYAGQPVVRIFDPTQMIVEAVINEPDVAVLAGKANARVYLDAYPDAVFEARLDSANPIATAGLDTPVRTFSARFRIDQQDPRLLPDLSVSLEMILPPIEVTKAATEVARSAPYRAANVSERSGQRSGPASKSKAVKP